MNRLLLRDFTAEIIRGAEASGLPRPQMAKVLGVSEKRLVALSIGIARLNPSQAEVLIDQTGKGIRTLLLRGIESQATTKRRAANANLMRDTYQLMKTLDSLDAEERADEALRHSDRNGNGHRKKRSSSPRARAV